MERFTLELTVANRCGVLNRVAEVYAKHKYNIEELTVCASDTPSLSVMRIVSRGDAAVQSQKTRQLLKLLDVKSLILKNNTKLD